MPSKGKNDGEDVFRISVSESLKGSPSTSPISTAEDIASNSLLQLIALSVHQSRYIVVNYL